MELVRYLLSTMIWRLLYIIESHYL